MYTVKYVRVDYSYIVNYYLQLNQSLWVEHGYIPIIPTLPSGYLT